MNRYYWTVCFISTMMGAPRVFADSVDLRVGQPFPTHLLLPTLEDGRPGSADLFLGKKTIVQIFASW